MKKGTIAKKLSAIVLAGAMLTSMGMTLSAEGVTGDGAAAVTSVPVTKTVTTDGNTYAPNTVFTIDVATAEAGEYDGNEVYAGVDGGLSGTTIQSAPGESTAASYTFNGSLAVNADAFANIKPGVYHYTVTETEDSYEGIDYSTESYDVYLYVYNGTSGNYVGNVVSVKEGVKTALGFTNNYGEGENDSTHQVTITKVISGDQAVSAAEFNFNVAVNGADGEKYKVVVAGSSSEGEMSVVSGSTLSNIKLGNGDTITIYGLTAGDTYTVTETDANTDGYKTTVDAQYGTGDGETTAITDKVSGSATTDTDSHTFYNTKNAVAPTGIVMATAPYILLVALAGVLMVLFLRRRREEI